MISGKVAAVADERWAVRVLAAYAASPGGPAHLVLAVIRVSAPRLVLATRRAPEPIRRVLWGVRPGDDGANGGRLDTDGFRPPSQRMSRVR